MNDIGHSDSFMIPQWFSFRQAANHRETFLCEPVGQPLDYGPSKEAFNDALADFRRFPNILIGAELMGAAQVLGLRAVAEELAEYVISEPAVGSLAIEQARNLLKQHQPEQRADYRVSLAGTKKRVRDFPRDAIAWLEQARLYTIIGQKKKAERAILAALHLAPNDRFIVRAAIRFFVHRDDLEKALHHAQVAYGLNKDPLIFGPLLSVATQINKLPREVNFIADHALRSKEVFLYSEVLEAMGTLELQGGSERKSRKFFKQAWTDPTKPVVGHSQWVLREKLPGLAEEKQLDFFSQNHHALSWLRFAVMDYRGAVAHTEDWALEEPYSRVAHGLGSYAASLVDDFNLAGSIAERGLRANPHDVTLRNNLAFTLLRSGKLQEAQNVFAPLLAQVNDENQIAVAATRGLLLMTEGKFAEGSKFYEIAVKRATKAQSPLTALRAVLNFLISSLDTTGTVDLSILNGAKNALKGNTDPGCLGAGKALVRRLNKKIRFRDHELGPVARDFSNSLETEIENYRNSKFVRFVEGEKI